MPQLNNDTPIELTVNLSTADLYELYFFQAIYHGWLFRGYLVLVLALLAATRPDGFDFLLPLLQPPLGYVPLAILAYYFVLRPFLLARNYIEQSLGGSSPADYVFDAAGIGVKRTHSASRIEWAAITRAKQTSRLFFLYSGKFSGFLIPKRSFVSLEQLTSFRNLVSKNVPKSRSQPARNKAR